jgi:NAD(P)-dependent dehydrogenase (short-subunit alcohol dehydrogenase family)
MLSTSGIRVNGFAPGFTQSSILTSSKDAEKGEQYSVKATEKEIATNHTKFFARAGLLDAQQYYYNRTMEPDELARVGVFLASDLSSAINGTVLLADSGRTMAATGEGCTGPIPEITPLV